MVGCSVGVCKSSSAKQSQMVLFPKEVNRKRKWEEFCSRGENFEASKYMKICKVSANIMISSALR